MTDWKALTGNGVKPAGLRAWAALLADIRWRITCGHYRRWPEEVGFVRAEPRHLGLEVDWHDGPIYSLGFWWVELNWVPGGSV